jgi:hypothetical protein
MEKKKTYIYGGTKKNTSSPHHHHLFKSKKLIFSKFIFVICILLQKMVLKGKIVLTESSFYTTCRCGMKFMNGKSRLALKLHKKKCSEGSDIDALNICEHSHNSKIKSSEHHEKILKESNKFLPINDLQDNKLFK